MDPSTTSLSSGEVPASHRQDGRPGDVSPERQSHREVRHRPEGQAQGERVLQVRHQPPDRKHFQVLLDVEVRF